MQAIAIAVKPFGLEYRNVAGIDLLMREGEMSARRAVHLYPVGSSELPAARTIRGIRLIPIEDLVRMKLNGFRLKDQTHLKDLDEARLITPEMEAGLPAILHEILIQVRTSE
jgi:hypothetical protein